MRSVQLAVVVSLLCSTSAFAAEDEAPLAAPSQGQGWSVLGARTVGNGSTALSAQFGFPGLSLTLLHGVADKVDLGGRFAVNYGYEGMVELVPAPGTKLEGVLRVALLNRGRVSLGLKFSPGLFLYFPTFGSFVGMTLPTSLVLGINAGSAVVVNVGFDVPMFVTFGPGGGLSVPVLFGGGVEYFFDRDLAVTFNTRLGATANPAPGFAFTRRQSRFTFEALVGVALKL